MAPSNSNKSLEKHGHGAVLVLNGPNLNLLGSRETSTYGSTTLEEIDAGLIKQGKDLGLEVNCTQSNIEGELVEAIHAAKGQYDVIVINPAAYGHTSVALRDAVLAVGIPIIEIHLTNIHTREEFRHTTYLQDVASGIIMGFGPYSYTLGLEAAAKLIQEKKT